MLPARARGTAAPGSSPNITVPPRKHGHGVGTSKNTKFWQGWPLGTLSGLLCSPLALQTASPQPWEVVLILAALRLHLGNPNRAIIHATGFEISFHSVFLAALAGAALWHPPHHSHTET